MGMTDDEMVGWHHWLVGHEFEQALGVTDGQGSLACCSPWGRRVRHNWVTELILIYIYTHTHTYTYISHFLYSSIDRHGHLGRLFSNLGNFLIVLYCIHEKNRSLNALLSNQFASSSLWELSRAKSRIDLKVSLSWYVKQPTSPMGKSLIVLQLSSK